MHYCFSVLTSKQLIVDYMHAHQFHKHVQEMVTKFRLQIVHELSQGSLCSLTMQSNTASIETNEEPLIAANLGTQEV